MNFQVVVTAESAPRRHEFWTLNGNFDKEFQTFAEAEAYVQKIEALQSDEDKADAYYAKFGPLIQILEVE